MGKSEKDIQSAEKVEMQSERASRALHFEVEMSKIRLVFPIINFQLMTTIWILDPATIECGLTCSGGDGGVR